MAEGSAGRQGKNNLVGPIIRGGEVAVAAIDAVEIDNPGKKIYVEDRGAYVRIECEQECILTRNSMEQVLGRPFKMREIEVNLSSFSGQIDTSSDRIRFYYTKHV